MWDRRAGVTDNMSLLIGAQTSYLTVPQCPRVKQRQYLPQRIQATLYFLHVK